MPSNYELCKISASDGGGPEHPRPPPSLSQPDIWSRAIHRAAFSPHHPAQAAERAVGTAGAQRGKRAHLMAHSKSFPKDCGTPTKLQVFRDSTWRHTQHWAQRRGAPAASSRGAGRPRDRSRWGCHGSAFLSSGLRHRQQVHHADLAFDPHNHPFHRWGC